MPDKMNQINDTLRLGAALFNGDHGHLADEVERLDKAGLDFIHLDVFDGHFVPDLGFSPRTIAALRPLTKLPFEIHLGAVDPLRFILPLVDAGADLILLHIESLSLVYEAVATVREAGCKVGLALTLGTPVEWLQPALPLVDAILLLSRSLGETVVDTSFKELVLPRIRQVRELANTMDVAVDIQVAGGVRSGHIPELVAAGATTVALGGGIYRAGDMAEEVNKMRELSQRPVREQ